MKKLQPVKVGDTLKAGTINDFIDALNDLGGGEPFKHVVVGAPVLWMDTMRRFRERVEQLSGRPQPSEHLTASAPFDALIKTVNRLRGLEAE